MTVLCYIDFLKAYEVEGFPVSTNMTSQWDGVEQWATANKDAATNGIALAIDFRFAPAFRVRVRWRALTGDDVPPPLYTYLQSVNLREWADTISYG